MSQYDDINQDPDYICISCAENNIFTKGDRNSMINHILQEHTENSILLISKYIEELLAELKPLT